MTSIYWIKSYKFKVEFNYSKIVIHSLQKQIILIFFQFHRNFPYPRNLIFHLKTSSACLRNNAKCLTYTLVIELKKDFWQVSYFHMASLSGFEPPTYDLGGRYSILLIYKDIFSLTTKKNIASNFFIFPPSLTRLKRQLHFSFIQRRYRSIYIVPYFWINYKNFSFNQIKRPQELRR